jgi:hypothetical protein
MTETPEKPGMISPKMKAIGGHAMGALNAGFIGLMIVQMLQQFLEARKAKKMMAQEEMMGMAGQTNANSSMGMSPFGRPPMQQW